MRELSSTAPPVLGDTGDRLDYAGRGVVERLDEEKLETLRRWGAGLEGDTRAELRASGRAILMLIDEIERLHVDLWHARVAEPAGDPEPVGREPREEPDAVDAALRERLAVAVPAFGAQHAT